MTSRPVVIRLILPFAATIVLVVVACGIAIYSAGQRNVRLEQINDLNRLATLVREHLSGDSITDDQRTQIHELARVLDTRITLIDAHGVVLLDTQADPAKMENHNGRPEVIAARTAGFGSSVRKSDTIHQRAVYVATPLDKDNPNGVVLRLSYPQSVWAKLNVPVWPILVAATLGALILMIWLGLILRSQWIEPIHALAETTDQMASGQWDARAHVRGAAELQFFSQRLNLAAEHAEVQLASLNHQRADLQALVDSLPDPIFLIDSSGQIALLNLAAAKIAQRPREAALNKRLVEIVNDEQIVGLYEAVIADSGSGVRHSEIRSTRGGAPNVYQAVGLHAQAGGVLLVLRNVTTMATAMQMKTDFVANASHELRTPIAAIKIAFETLGDVYQEDPQQTEKCIGIIDGHIQRLEDMLADLLDLSRVESPDKKPDIAPLKAGEVFATIRSTMTPLARQKSVNLNFQGDEEYAFPSDKRLLDLVVKNLVENSVKFTPAGGNVTVQIEPNNGDAIVRVVDTGIGISRQHLERVFERFYQVDAARSSAAGRGTGLGLAIVKHAVHALGGAVSLDSELGKGTRVECRFPIAAHGSVQS
jgi:two-component system phosphate regulon sensor histidine kinase PhoR